MTISSSACLAAIATSVLSGIWPASAMAVRPSQPPPLTLWQAKNAEYQLAFDGRNYKLKDGKLVSGSMAKGNYINIQAYKIALGDMDGDGAGDAAVLLAVSGGGSGTFHELAVLINRGGKAVYAATKRGLGDRNIVDSLSIVRRIAAIDMKVPGPGDPLCCPSKKVRWKFALKWDKRNKHRVIQIR